MPKITMLTQRMDADGWSVGTDDGVTHYVSNDILHGSADGPIALDASGRQDYPFKDDENNNAIELLTLGQVSGEDAEELAGLKGEPTSIEAQAAALAEPENGWEGYARTLFVAHAIVSKAADDARAGMVAKDDEIASLNATITGLKQTNEVLARGNDEQRDDIARMKLAGAGGTPSKLEHLGKLEDLPTHRALDDAPIGLPGGNGTVG